MEKGVVYKQRYSSVSEKATLSKNISHLIYIATRPGTIYNEDCAFGLWGKFNDMKFAGNINNLEEARERVKAISSERKTIYRGVVSLGGLDAKNKGYLTREKWQELITSKIGKIAAEKNMNISPDSFEWMASYHNEPDHPHCHILFWDKSDDIRNEFITPQRFEIMSESIRAEFNREIYRDEIKNLFAQGDNLKSQMKGSIKESLSDLEKILLFEQSDYESSQDTINLLCGAMLELNTPETLSLRFTDDYLTKLAKDIDNVIIHIPAKGSLKYQYISPVCKEAVDQLTDTLLENHDFKKLKDKYISTRTEVSKLYGNSTATIEYNKGVAIKALYSDMGNILLTKLKGLNLLTLDNQRGIDYLAVLHNKLPELTLSELVDKDDYISLKDSIPKMRLPMKRFMDKEKWQKVNTLVKSSPTVNDYRDLLLKLSDKESLPTANREMLSPLQKQITHTLLEQIKSEKGWYKFRDNVNSCTELAEVETIFIDTKNRLYSALKVAMSDNESVVIALKNITDMLPTYHQPFSTFYTEDFRKVVDVAMQFLMENEEIYSLGSDYIDCKLKGFTLQPPDNPVNSLSSLAYSCLYKEINHAIMDYCFEQKGWKEQYRNEVCITLTASVFSLLSQSVNQHTSQCSALSGQARKLFSKDMSKQQKREAAQKLRSGINSYEDEWGAR